MDYSTVIDKSGTHVAQKPPAQRQSISSAPAFNAEEHQFITGTPVTAGAYPDGGRQAYLGLTPRFSTSSATMSGP